MTDGVADASASTSLELARLVMFYALESDDGVVDKGCRCCTVVHYTARELQELCFVQLVLFAINRVCVTAVEKNKHHHITWHILCVKTMYKHHGGEA